jgi:hypothetical protein
MKFLLLLFTIIITLQVQAKYYYVDPVSGLDTNEGTSIKPWKTVKHALGTDSPIKGGDILQLKPGIYQEESIRVQIQSLNKKFIKVRGGAGVIFDGSDQAMSNIDLWTLVDSDKRIYVYNKAVKHNGQLSKLFFRGFYDYRGERNALIAYKDGVNFHSTYETSRLMHSEIKVDTILGRRYYAGPGTFYDSEKDSLYLRMSLPSSTAVPAERTLPPLAHNDLSEIEIFIAKPQTTNLVGFDISGDIYLRFENIKFFNFQLPIFNITHKKKEIIREVKFHKCDFENNSMCIITSHVDSILVQQCKFTQHIPDYISFNDGKGGTHYEDINGDTLVATNPASRITGDALFFGNRSRGIKVRDCNFEDMWDCVQFSNSALEVLPDSTKVPKPDKYPKDCKVYRNTFKEVMDDAVEINNDAMDIDVYENEFLEVTFGLSISGQRITDQEDPKIYKKGKIFYHHNVVDAVPKFGGRANRNHKGYRYSLNSPFMGSHNVGKNTKCAVKMYHNTLRMRNGFKNRWIDLKNNRYLPNLVGSESTAMIPISDVSEIPEKAMEVYNNIFVFENFNFKMDTDMRLYTGKELWNGNVYHRKLPGINVPCREDIPCISEGTCLDFIPCTEKNSCDSLCTELKQPMWKTLFPSTSGEVSKSYANLNEFREDVHFYNQTKFLGKRFEEDGNTLTTLELTPNFKIKSTSIAATGAIDLSIKEGWPQINLGEQFRGAKPPIIVESLTENTKKSVKLEFENDRIFPNPFKDKIHISVDQSQDGPLTILLFDVLGKPVSTIYNNPKHLYGQELIYWNAANCPAGTYYVRIEKPDGIKTIKVIKSE